MDAPELDRDLSACLENNPQDGWSASDIAAVRGVYERESEDYDNNWVWLLTLTNGSWVVLMGGCDYTGWDCQSWAESRVGSSAEEVMGFAPDDSRETLRTQLEHGLSKTARQRVGESL